MRRGPNIESSIHCLIGARRDIDCREGGSELTMLTEKFDAYGEVSPAAARDAREACRTASAMLGRVGQLVFWLLVIVIIVARVIWYPATPTFDVGSASTPKQAITR